METDEHKLETYSSFGGCNNSDHGKLNQMFLMFRCFSPNCHDDKMSRYFIASNKSMCELKTSGPRI